MVETCRLTHPNVPYPKVHVRGVPSSLVSSMAYHAVILLVLGLSRVTPMIHPSVNLGT